MMVQIIVKQDSRLYNPLKYLFTLFYSIIFLPELNNRFIFFIVIILESTDGLHCLSFLNTQ